MTLFEVNQAAALIRETAHPEVNMIFGAVIDPELGDEVRITVIATGFERTAMPRRLSAVRPVNRVLADGKPISQTLETVDVEARPSQPAAEFKPKTFNTEDLDIPTFLRNRK